MDFYMLCFDVQFYGNFTQCQLQFLLALNFGSDDGNTSRTIFTLKTFSGVFQSRSVSLPVSSLSSTTAWPANPWGRR